MASSFSSAYCSFLSNVCWLCTSEFANRTIEVLGKTNIEYRPITELKLMTIEQQWINLLYLYQLTLATSWTSLNTSAAARPSWLPRRRMKRSRRSASGPSAAAGHALMSYLRRMVFTDTRDSSARTAAAVAAAGSCSPFRQILEKTLYQLFTLSYSIQRTDLTSGILFWIV